MSGCRLPALKTRQTFPCSSQAPLRPRQTFLQLQQGPEAVALSFYGGSRLPFASLETRQTLPCSSQAPLRPRQTFPAAPIGPEAVAVSFYGGSRLPCQLCKLAKPSPAAPRRHSGHGRPFLQLQQVSKAVAVSFMEVQGCRLPALKTRQTVPSSQAPLRPRQTFSCSSNKALRPWQ